MKKLHILYFILICTLPLLFTTSCTKEPEGAGLEEREIVIGIEAGDETRATAIDETNKVTQLNGKAVGVRGVHYDGSQTKAFFGTAPSVAGMNAVTATVANNSGTLNVALSPTQLWPLFKNGSETMDFYAWYPYDAANTSPSVGFTGASISTLYYECSAQQDLMVARTTVTTAAASDPVRAWNKPVPMHFNHALARITISAKKTDASMGNTVIESITLKNAVIKGSVAVFPAAWPAKQVASESAIPNFTWTAASGGSGNVRWPASGSAGSSVGTASTLLNDFLMIPMASVTGVTLEVVASVDGDAAKTYNVALSGLSAHGWISGKRTAYVLSIDKEKVTVNSYIEAADWDGPINLDGNVGERVLHVETYSGTITNQKMARIRFWATPGLKASDVYVMPTGYYNMAGTGATFTVNNRFRSLAGASAAGLHYDPATGEGYLDVITDYGQGQATNDTRYMDLYAGGLLRRIKVTIDVGPIENFKHRYSGTFHRWKETGERLILDNYDYNGSWTATVTYPGSTAPFVKLAWGKTIDENIWTDTPADPEIFQVEGNVIANNGKVTGYGAVALRVGMADKLASETTAPRYAKITISGGTAAVNRVIYVRQGEEADYVMRPTESGTPMVTRSYARKFSPYNVTDPNKNTQTNQASMSNGTGHLLKYGGKFVDYPTQTGYFFQFNVTRKAFHPTLPPGAFGGWSDLIDLKDTWNDETKETCPSGYRRPSDGPLADSNGPKATSEIRQSLLLTPFDGNESVTDNTAWGYYADGFFDRREMTRTSGTSGGSYFAVVANATADAAYIGQVFYNPATFASLFIPASGYRSNTTGSLEGAGRSGYFWSTSCNSTTKNAWNLAILEYNGGSSTIMAANSHRTCAQPVRCVVR